MLTDDLNCGIIMSRKDNDKSNIMLTLFEKYDVSSTHNLQHHPHNMYCYSYLLLENNDSRAVSMMTETTGCKTRRSTEIA